MADFFSPMPRAMAHRGDSLNFPENTEPAFRAAAELGIDVIETDVHLTADEQVLIWHDPTLERMSGDPRKIEELPLKELKKVDAGACFSRDGGKTFPFRGRGIVPLLLEEALELFPRSRFNIDLKSDDPRLARAAAEAIRRRGAEKRVCLASFHHAVLREYRAFQPETATSLSPREIRQTILASYGAPVPRAVRKGRARAIQMPEYHKGRLILTERLIKLCKKWNMAVQIWTVNDPAEMDRLFRAGADGIFSDDAAEAVRAAERSFREPRS